MDCLTCRTPLGAYRTDTGYRETTIRYRHCPHCGDRYKTAEEIIGVTMPFHEFKNHQRNQLTAIAIHRVRFDY